MNRAEIPAVTVTAETGSSDAGLLGRIGFLALVRRLSAARNTTATTQVAEAPSTIFYEGDLPKIAVPDGLGAKTTSKVDLLY